jgi:hypothetical protein
MANVSHSEIATLDEEAAEKTSRTENKVLMVNEYVEGEPEFVFTTRCSEVSA